MRRDSVLRYDPATLMKLPMKQLGMGLLAVILLGSCNTTIGISRDLRQLGEGMERKAQGGTFTGEEPEYDENLPTY